ncbi:hypothetical protein SAMN06295909_3121 [Plantibacter sp. VKM Ac-1784]|uniref:Uncharacterized protein n=2 Tax=Plantibacter elymi (nom. nud.) TaxID=199708 RepID=A0ABY1RGH7_9MICO|nr:hypothetical protein SAMN06295909_3121 [Plantibacter sp. VKM Ac-1784]
MATPWALAGKVLPDFLEGWDPQTDLELSCAIAVEVDEFLTMARLPADTRLRLTVSWSSSTSGMSDWVYLEDLRRAQTVDALLPGERIGGTVVLRTTITLAEDRQPMGPGEVHRAGSVLWERLQSVRLHGEGSMFPIGVADFAGTPYGANASWYLQTSEDLSAPFLGTFLLLVNSRDEALIAAINQKKTSPLGQQLLSNLEAGVAMIMIELALGHEGADLGSYSDDSVGSVLSRYLTMAHEEGLTSAVRADDPGRFRSLAESIVRAHGYGRTFE